MNTKPIPAFFQLRILLALGLGALISALSLTLCLALHNSSILLPGIILGLVLIGRAGVLFMLAKRGHYREAEATCIRIEIKGYRRHIRLVTFEIPGHAPFSIALEKGEDLCVGERFLLYFQADTQQETYSPYDFIDLCKISS